MTTERERIERARDHLRKAEADWRKAIAEVLGVANENDNPTQANAAFGVAADLTDELGAMMRSHWRGTMVLLETWPQYGEIVVMGGGGGR
jgi:hypothetical protein